MKRVVTLDQIEVALFGTTDGGMLDDDTELPVGEMRRLLREAFEGNGAAVRGGRRPYLAKFAIEALHAARQAMPADQITVDVIVHGMDAAAGCDLGPLYGVEMIRTAAQWALTQQPAADMPPGSVVATVDAAYIKEDPNNVMTLFTVDPSKSRPWSAGWGADASDAEIDVWIASGEAEVLRVGDGE